MPLIKTIRYNPAHALRDATAGQPIANEPRTPDDNVTQLPFRLFALRQLIVRRERTEAGLPTGPALALLQQ